jgi:NAD(P)-dependent dehydrogenase (short-subunit alcohol dehydrogenase family)
MQQRNKSVIVTGAASGIGRAMALGLAEAGFDVVAVDRSTSGLGTLPASIKPIAADLARPGRDTCRPATETVAVLGGDAGTVEPVRDGECDGTDHDVTGGSTAYAEDEQRAHHYREGYLLYGSSKAAAESAMAVLAADLAGTGVTANVLVPGGVTDTPLVGDAGDRSKMLRPQIMVPPLLWLVSDEAAEVSGRRFIAADWDTRLPPAEAAHAAGAPVAWLSIARMPIEPG